MRARDNSSGRFVRRPRLYRLLDDAGARSVVWLGAAGGYGKSTLARAWAQTRGWPVVAVAVPESGMTVGEFFFSLREATADALGEAAGGLPLFGPDYGGAPDLFAQHFHRELARRIQGTLVMCVDDLHNVPVGHPLHGALVAFAGCLEETPLRLLVCSRCEPPRPWARLRGRGALDVVDEQALAFTVKEIGDLCECHGLPRPGRADRERLHGLTGGWAAGLMLLLEQWRRTGRLDQDESPGSSLVDWFLNEVFLPLPEEDRELLCLCALPSRVPRNLVAEASGCADAVARLERLREDHAFVQLDEATGHYRLHDLFRGFLRERARVLWTTAAYRGHAGRWAQLLWAQGEWSPAAALQVETGDSEGLAANLRQAAPALLQTGRGENLYHWLSAIPEQARRADAELTLWEGLCLILHDTRRARALLGEAWEALARRRALVPMAIAWTGIVDSIWLEWAHVSEYERWIDEFHRFEDDFRRELPPPLWFSVLRGILVATCYGRPLDPGLGRLEREAETALCGEMPDTERVMLAGQLMFLNTWQFGRRDGAARVMSVMAQRPESIARASPLARCVWQTFSSLWNLLFEADLEASLAEARTGRELILEHGISTWDNAVPPLQAALCFEDRENLDDWMAWFLRADPKANRPFYDTFQAHFMAGQAWLRGDVHEAVGHCRQSLLAAERHGSVVIFSAFRALLAACLAESGQLREALREAARARRIRAGFPSDFLDLMMYLPLARIPLLAGRSRRALPALRRAFEAGARQRMFFPFMVRRDELAMLCGLALQAGITPDYAAWLIRARDLAPPDDPGIRLEWPWRCRIHVLGRFDVEVDAQVNDTRPKARQRMHALLSQLILAGPEGIEQEALAERLWPDSPPERALNSLHVTIHRLRDFLREPALLRTHGGRVALCADRVWVDLWEFERLAALADRLDLPLLRRLVSLYGGAARLEPADDLDLQLRQAALLQAFERLALRVGLELEPVDPERSQGHYRAALSHSPLQDELWAGLLRCDAVLGGLGAVERTWRLLSGQYRESLDMEPPARLKALYDRLLAQLVG